MLKNLAPIENSQAKSIFYNSAKSNEIKLNLSTNPKRLSDNKFEEFLSVTNRDKEIPIIKEAKNSSNSLEIEPKSPRSILKKPSELAESSNLKLQKMELKSHFERKNNIKKISQIIINSHLSESLENDQRTSEKMVLSSKLRELKLSKIEQKPIIKLPTQKEIRRINITEQPLTIIIPNEQIEPTGTGPTIQMSPRLNTLNIPIIPTITEPISPTAMMSPKNQNSNIILNEDFKLNDLLHHKIEFFGNKKIDMYYEINEEIPTLKLEEEEGKVKPKEKDIKLSVYKNYNNDDKFGDDIIEINSSLRDLLLKVDPVFYTFSRNQKKEIIKEYFQEIYRNSLKTIQLLTLFFVIFILFACLSWIIVLENIQWSQIFFSLRLATILGLLITIKLLSYVSFQEYFKKVFFLIYLALAIQILAFSIYNPQIEYVMELEILACYLSLTKQPFVMFVESLIISVLFIFFHLGILYAIQTGNFLMLHSTVAVIFFNLSTIHLNIKLSIDNFNKFRVSVLKKQQMNNLVENLLPIHVIFFL